MRSVVLIFFAVLMFDCSADRWEKRYKEEAKSMCDCLNEYRKTITPALQQLYDTAISFNYTNSYTIDSEHVAMVRAQRNLLSAEEEDWNQRLNRDFSDKNSKLSKCWYKRFEWSNENPGNNFKYTPSDYAREMGCTLVSDLTTIHGYDQLEEALYK